MIYWLMTAVASGMMFLLQLIVLLFDAIRSLTKWNDLYSFIATVYVISLFLVAAYVAAALLTGTALAALEVAGIIAIAPIVLTFIFMVLAIAGPR